MVMFFHDPDGSTFQAVEQSEPAAKVSLGPGAVGVTSASAREAKRASVVESARSIVASRAGSFSGLVESNELGKQRYAGYLTVERRAREMVERRERDESGHD
jgi:hypothetical protein